MTKLFRAHIYVLWRSPFTWFSIAALLLMVSITFLFAYYVFPRFGVDMTQYGDMLGFPNVLFSLLFNLARIYGILIALFYAAMAVGSEYTWGTVRLPLLLAYRRWQVALSKWLALSLNMATALLLSCLVGVLIGRFGAAHQGFPMAPLAANEFLIAVRIYLLLALGVATYVALATLLTTLMRSPLLAFAAGLLIFMIEVLFVDVVVTQNFIWFRPYLLYFSFSSLVVNTELPHSLYPLFTWLSFVIVVAYGIFFLLGLVLKFNRQNIHE